METTFQATMNAEHHHTAIRVRDMAGMRRFYGEVLGLPFLRQQVDEQGPRVVWFHAVQLIRSAADVDPRAGTMDHLAISVLNLDALVDRLTRHGTALEAPVSHADVAELGLHLDFVFFRDPEGNRVELVQWLPLPVR